MEEASDWAQTRVLRFLAELSGRPAESIRLHEPLFLNFDLDSLEHVEFLIELEDELGIEIPDPVNPWRTVGDLVKFVREAVE